ncbi:MAG: protein kinase [Myxococcales bacterium]|nr:protein kinase [Myxococcales bacterium]MCB9750803.1 protein kinase [Myxococcales bacterium]
MEAAGAKQGGPARAQPTISELSDVELIRAFKERRDDTTFSELVRRHQIPTFRLLVGYLGDADEAEPLCERVFVDASQRIDELVDPAAFDAWIFRLASERARKAEVEASSSGRPRRPPPPATADPHTHLKHEIREVLRELPGELRLALVLAELHGDTPERVASLMRVEVAAARDLIARARAQFVEALDRRSNAAAVTADDGPPSAGAPAAAPLELDDDDDEEVFQPGTVVARRYRVRRLLGLGGFGAVYEAFDERKKRLVALKVLLASVAARSVIRKRFKREAELIRRVQHDNFVRVFDFGHASEGFSYMSMELIEGESLAELLHREILEPARALHIARHTLRALAHAHRLGVIHRDIKPGNLMITRRQGDSSFVRVLDLGIAKLVDREGRGPSAKLSRTGQILGTPAYMSPEQAAGEALDQRSDLYAVAVVLFEMLTARPPFSADSDVAVLAMQVAKPPPMLADFAPGRGWSDEIEALMRRALSKEPAARFRTADEFLAALEGLEPLRPGGGTAVATTPRMEMVRTVPGETLETPHVQPRRAPEGDAGTGRVITLIVVFALAIGGGVALWLLLVP